MNPSPEPRILLTSRASWADSQSRALRRRVASGDIERLRRGVMRPVLPPLETVEWAQRHGEARLRYLDRVRAVGETRRRDVVFSHLTALAILDLPHLGPWPATVDIIEPDVSKRRSKRGVVVHRGRVEPDEILPWEGFFVTSPARAIAELARAGHAMAAVVALDHALGPRAAPGHTLTKDAMHGTIEAMPRWGRSRALELVEFADARSGSPGESGSRLLFSELGFEVPELQVRHPLPSGGYFDTDFKWRKSRRFVPLIGEFDGVGKYLKPEYLGELSPGDAVMLEKRREDALRALDGSDFMRWGMPEVLNPERLRRLAEAHGVPRAPRRPK